MAAAGAAPGVGELSALVLFLIAIGILLWPLGRRLREARRQRAELLRVAAGEALEGEERGGQQP
jgi:hypothetical protein